MNPAIIGLLSADCGNVLGSTFYQSHPKEQKGLGPSTRRAQPTGQQNQGIARVQIPSEMLRLGAANSVSSARRVDRAYAPFT